MSVVVHVVLIVVLGLSLRAMPRTGAAHERTAEVGIALKKQVGDKEFFHSEDDAGRSESTNRDQQAAVDRAQVFSETAPSDPSTVLPSSLPALGPGVFGDEGGASAADATTGSVGRGDLGKGKARINIFGIEGHGYKFVYVFDRSDSMGALDRLPIRAAKAELIASLKSLDRTHQFQVIFYNQEPYLFQHGDQKGRLNFATERNKEFARRFVEGIEPSGSTSHTKALDLAVRLHPEVIFFLTDADTPRLSNHEIKRIAREAAGTTINAVEFGNGPKQSGENWLARLARATGGQYRYVNILDLTID
jgi:hypothetical protein